MQQAHRKLFYDRMCWLRYVTHIRNLLGPHHVICIDASKWIQDDSPFDGPLHLSAQGAARFSQHVSNLLSPDRAHLSLPSGPENSLS